jgi:preprotein translocase SecE subunit
VARNRKRAKERRARRPQALASPTRDPLTGAPSPLEHAAPGAELAEQAELPPLAADSEFDEPEPGEAADDAAFEGQDELELTGGGDGGGGGELAAPGAAIPEPAPRAGNRLIGFLQGSWRELQRVQWPDRRQVMQATGVVIGFVIIAGLWLGAADWAAKHIVNYILYGHS